MVALFWFSYNGRKLFTRQFLRFLAGGIHGLHDHAPETALRHCVQGGDGPAHGRGNVLAQRGR